MPNSCQFEVGKVLRNSRSYYGMGGRMVLHMFRMVIKYHNIQRTPKSYKEYYEEGWSFSLLVSW